MTINLIPPQLKKEKQTRKISGLILTILSMITVVLLIVCAFLFISNYWYGKDIKDIESKTEEQNDRIKKYADIEQKVTKANSKIEQLKKITQDKISWSLILQNLSSCTPTEVQIKTANASGIDYKIVLTGNAATRRDIARFKEKLEESIYFKNVVFSTSSLDTESNTYNFSLSAELESVQ